MNESRRRPLGDTEGELRRLKMQVFYLACREAFRGRTPTPSEDRLLHELQEALALPLDHARRLGRLARQRGQAPELSPARPLTRARVQGLARRIAEASGLPRPRWWRHHLLLRASLRLRGQEPGGAGAGFVAQLDQGVEAALYESLATPPAPGEQAPPSWMSRARRGLGALIGLALALQGTSWLIGDLTSTRQEDPSAPQRLSLLMAEAQQARDEGDPQLALQLLRKAEGAAMRIPGDRARHMGIFQANLEQARTLRNLSVPGDAARRQHIQDAYEEALFALQEAEASEAERARLGAELRSFRQDPTNRAARNGRGNPV